MKSSSNNRLLRSLLFVPGHRERFIEKSSDLAMDAVILDIEDAVPVDKKEDSRELIRQKVSEGFFSNTQVFIRLNDIESGLIDDDLEKTAIDGVDGYMFPMAGSAEDILYFEKKLKEHEKNKGYPVGKFLIIPLIETPKGIINSYSIGESSERVIALSFGNEDYLTELGGIDVPGRENLFVPQAMMAMAARASGCQPIDTVYVSIKDIKGFEEEVHRARSLGYSGKLLVHPSQIEITHRYLSPSLEEIEWATNVMDIAEKALKEGYGVVRVDDKFVGPPFVKRAKKIVALAELIRGKERNEKEREINN